MMYLGVVITAGGLPLDTSRQNRGKVSFGEYSYARMIFSMSSSNSMAWNFELTLTQL